ncbi:hypothetical protein Tco_1382392, partial [Tanacetum coccineum]
VANSTTEAEYVAAANCCGQVLWIQNQMLDYGYNFMNTKIFINNESTICIVKNLVFHSKTKNIEIRHHFIRDSYEKRLIQVIKIHTDHNVADLLTKAIDMKLELLNASFDCKDFFKRGVIMLLRCFKLATLESLVEASFLLESLGNEAYRALEARNVTIAQTTLGEMYQLILNALAKLCNKKKFLTEFERTGKRLGTIVTFLASKARYASFPRDSGKELRKACFRLTSSTPIKQ